MKPDELRNWILFISAISAIVIGVAHYLKNIAYDSIDSLFFGLKDDSKRETIKFVAIFIVSSFLFLFVTFFIRSLGSSENSFTYTDTAKPNILTGTLVYYFILAVVIIIELSRLDKNVLKLSEYIIDVEKHKRRYETFQWVLIVTAPLAISISFVDMILNIEQYIEYSIFALVLYIFIFLYSSVLYGIYRLKLDLVNLKKSTIVFNNQSKENLVCRVIKIKGDFIYYIDDKRIKCINKSSVLDIYELEKNKELIEKNENTFIKCAELFNYIEKDLNKEDKKLEDIANLYNNIKDYYIEKIKTNNNFIIYEKLRLEGELGKYTKNIFNINLNMGVIILTVLVTMFLESTKVFDIINITQFHYVINIILNTIIRMGTFFILLFGCLYNLKDKNSEQEKCEEVLNNIRLKVLKNIEKEIQEKGKIENVDIQNTNNEVLREISATDDKDSNSFIKKGIIGKILKKK
ncbi:hypothetical protein [Clostridium intestinale]|uniref:hypothetical protein n=1 Tax=Clostridium intestinale TaxID=36845 RepID=UPI0028F07E28|nr:hypothetical protein [Clostridium intestinale]